MIPPVTAQISRVHGVGVGLLSLYKGITNPVSSRSCGAGTGLAVNVRGNPTSSLTHPLFSQISRVHGVGVELLSLYKGKTCPVSSRSCGAGTGLAVNARGNPTSSLTHPLFSQISRGYGVGVD
ncbi:hypothetical protein D3C78_286130 [compost metagenome]